jgi:hypothetical protein
MKTKNKQEIKKKRERRKNTERNEAKTKQIKRKSVAEENK